MNKENTWRISWGAEWCSAECKWFLFYRKYRKALKEGKRHIGRAVARHDAKACTIGGREVERFAQVAHSARSHRRKTRHRCQKNPWQTEKTTLCISARAPLAKTQTGKTILSLQASWSF
jgi:ribosomal protein L28